MKKFLIFSLVVILFSGSKSYASSELNSTLFQDENKYIIGDKEVSPNMLPTIKKVNVRKYQQTGSFVTISNRVQATSNQFVTITSSKGTSFTTQVSGDISGLGFSTSKSISAEVGYSIQGKGPGTFVMQAAPVYSVETGTKQQISAWSGLVISSNSYTIKVPINVTYRLVKV